MSDSLAVSTSVATRSRPGRRWTALCGNPDCNTGWLRLWRSRAHPRFDDAWACSAECMQQSVGAAIRTQIEDWDQSPAERALRMPLGLILLSRGWISREELQVALSAQRSAQQGQIGEWLRRLCGVSEATIAKALAIQWNCAILLSQTPGLESVPTQLPSFLQRQYELKLVRQGAQSDLYLAGRCRAEHAATRAVEHMLGVPVRAAFLEDSEWQPSQPRIADAGDLMQSGADGAAACIAELIEQSRPANARLARIHDHLWLRMWGGRHDGRRFAMRDVVLPLRANEYSRCLLRVS